MRDCTHCKKNKDDRNFKQESLTCSKCDEILREIKKEYALMDHHLITTNYKLTNEERKQILKIYLGPQNRKLANLAR